MTPERTSPSPPPSILSPIVDFLCVGGLSLIVFVPLLLSGRSDLCSSAPARRRGSGRRSTCRTSWRRTGSSTAAGRSILRHKWASIYVPAILARLHRAGAVGSTGAAVADARHHPGRGLERLSRLALHRPGVGHDGVVRAISSGTSFDKRERLLIRTSLRILLAWHVTWFLYTQLRDPSTVRPLYLLVSAGTVVAFVLGAIGLAMMRRRTGKLPPARALVAWLAIFVWYAVMARDPKAIFWIQIAHALQYLAFPIRVEINRTAATREASPSHFVMHMVGLRRAAARRQRRGRARRSGRRDERRRQHLRRGAGTCRSDPDPDVHQHPPLLHGRRDLEHQQSRGPQRALRARQTRRRAQRRGPERRYFASIAPARATAKREAVTNPHSR